MATKVKPSRIQSTGQPQVGQVPVYVDENTFSWGESGKVKVFEIQGPLDYATAEESRLAYLNGDPVIVMFGGNAYQYTTDSMLYSDIPTVFSTTTISVHMLNYTMSGSSVTGITSDIMTFTKPGVVDNLTSTSTSDALSANQGRVLKGLIDNLTSRGRFLSLWNSATGLAMSNPQSFPYTYQTGDYFIVGVTGATNYRPDGSSYTGTASTVVESEDVQIGDTYVYDGTDWLLQLNHGKTVTFSEIAGDPYDNTNLANALADKQDELVSGVNIRTINGTSVLGSGDITTPTGPTYTAGANVQISAQNVISATDTTYTAGSGIDITNGVISNTQNSAEWGNIIGTLSSQTDLQNALDAKQNVTNMVTTLSGADNTHYPTTKAVADAISAAGGGDVLGPSSATDGDIALFDGNTGKLIKDSGKKLDSYQAKLTAGNNITISAGIPDAYTQLEYIESDGTQAIDTGIVLNQNSVAELDFQLTDLTDSNSFFGARASTTGRAFSFSVLTATGEWRIGWNNASPGYGTADLDRHTVVIDGGSLKVTLDGVQLTTLTSASFTTPVNAALFAIRASTGTGWYYGSGKTYRCKIYNGTALVGDFIPVKRIADGELGMYNLANQQFYTNDGTGTFIEGPVSSTPLSATIISATDTTYGSATQTTAGLVKLGSDTVQTQQQNIPTATAGKTYAVQANSNGEMVVNVPWTDTATTVDSALSPTSTNPVENRIINSALNNKQDTLIAGDGISLEKVYPDTQGPCEDGFHVPLDSEWTDLYDVFIALGGTSAAGANFRDYFKLPYAGGRGNASASEDNKGSYGYYWSATARGIYAKSVRIRSAGVQVSYDDRRSYGFSIRPFKNTPVVPTSSWTTVVDGSGVATGAGIFWNETDGLISLSSDGENWITISDKNLGATTVWASGDTLSEANCGKYYQWGNNYGFAFTGTLTTSSTLVNTSSYGPGNYYSSDTFITTSSSPFDWSSPANDNLWGGESQGEWTEPVISNTGVLSVNGQTGDVTVQETLVSGTNIKTINNTSVLGSGDIAVQPTLVSGTNIKTINGSSVLGSGDLEISGLPSQTGQAGKFLTTDGTDASWATVSGGITNDTTGTTTTVTKIWAGTSTEYSNLGTYDSSTIYHIY